MKDVPTIIADNTILPCILPRETTNDVFISNKYNKLTDVPDYSTIGSASLRRKSQLLQINPTWKVINFRGNVQTRLKKLAKGDCDGTLLALAGLKRLNMHDLIKKSEIISQNQILPAVAQGAIGIQCRINDQSMINILKSMNDPITHACTHAERSFLYALDGNCRTPIACQMKIVNSNSMTKENKSSNASSKLIFNGLVAKPNGQDMIKIALQIPLSSTSTFNNAELLETAGKLGYQIGSFVKEQVIGTAKYEEYKDSFIE